VEERYRSDPRLGIMTEKQFKEAYNGQKYRFYPLLAQLLTGNISIEN